MANIVFAPSFFLSAQYSSTAFAIAIPSYVEVPLPISSSTINEEAVACFKIFAVSLISTMKVDCPEARSSEAPILVNILSTIPTVADLAGTKEPICAIRIIRAVCLIYVDLPAMFGPVTIATLFRLSSRSTSLGTKGMSFRVCSTTGCLPAFISRSREVSISGFT